MDIILALVQPLAEGAVRHVFHYKSNIEHLNEQVLLLRDKREGVNLEVKPALDASKIIDPGVDRWLVDVDKIIVEAETSFSEETVAAKAACCNGWLPNLKCRHSLGRKAKKMTEKLDKLLANEPRTIVHPAAPPKVEFQPTEHSTLPEINFHEGASSSGTSTQEQPPASEGNNINFDSRRSTIRDVMEALKGNQFNPIIICGMGGIGKTTLMGQVFEKAKEEGLFDEYTKATVKESLDKAPDVIQIQAELAEYLGKNILEDKKEIDARASKLHARLSEGSKKFLVMLDNVSTTPPDFLWNIGIPFFCKLLVTSRQQDLFKNLGTRKNFPIDGLPDTDAWSLFKKTAGSSIESDRELEVVAREVLKECAGLPIAISTVGTALKGENIAVWKNALSELKKPSPENVPGVIEHVNGTIKFSYECLPSKEAKSCLLLCCIFGESADIEIEDLVRYGLGLKLFKGIDSMVEGRNSMEILVQTLKNRFFLLESNKKEYVRMHDVVRDVVVHIASEEFVEKKNDGVEKRIVVKDKAETVKLMDWPQNSVSEQFFYCSSLNINGLCQLLLLRAINESKLEPPPTIFSRMKDLNVLVIKSMSLLSLLPSLAVLKNLQTLRLEWCDLECDVSVIGELRTLRILSLSGSDIKQLPDTFKNLSNLRLLDLSYCVVLEIISPGVISSLSRLEELYMWHSIHNWLVECCILSDLFSLFCSPALEVVLPTAHSYILLSNDLGRLTIPISGNYLRVDDLITSSPVGGRINLLVKKCNSLELTMKNLTRPLNVLVREYCFANLKSLALKDCDALEHLIDVTLAKPVPCSSIFPVLNSLEIKGASRLKEIFHGELPMGSLKKLRKLVLDSLPALTYIWKIESKSECLRDILRSLEVLKIQDCSALEEIVALEGSERHEEEADKEINFQSLVELTLSNLPIFTGISKKVWFPMLERLTIHGLPKLTTIWHTQVAPNIFSRLRYITVQQCNSLKSILPAKEINFQSLTELNLSNLPSFTGIRKNILDKCTKLETSICNPCSSSTAICRETEEAATNENLETSVVPYFLFDEKVWFPMLERLTINGLPKLTTIWHTQVAPNSFCRLRDITVQKCNSLKNILPDSIIATAFQQLQKLTVEDCGVEEIVAEEEGLQKLMRDHFFPKLECLELKTLFQLERLYPRMHAAFSWPLLKTLVLFDCRKVDSFAAKDSFVLFDEIIFQSTFPRLEDLTLGPMDIWYGRPVPAVSCEKALFHTNSCRHTDGSVPPLRRLRLHGMEKLMCVCKNAEPAGPDIPRLEILEVEFCGLYNLELFAISFQNLTSLEVTFCWRLQYLTTYSVAKSLVKLKKLKVDECKSMIQVIAGEDASNCEIVFSQLRHLELSDLINLERFCSKNCTVKVPSLETSALEVKWCPFKLKISSDKVLEEDFSDMHLPVQKSHSRKQEPNLGKQLPSKQVDDVQIKSWSQSLSKLDADRSRLQEELRAIEAERRETEQKLADATV